MNKFESKCEFHDKYRDTITGFEGRCTGIAFYADQDTGILLTPMLNKDGDFRSSHWIPESRVEAVDDSARSIGLGG